MVDGYAGKILRVNLTDRKINSQNLDLKLAKRFVGGLGIGARMLYEELEPNIDPLGPENKIIISTGPLTGTIAPLGSKSYAITKSPLTGAFLDCVLGGHFGPELRYAGYDAIIIEGQAELPVLLQIHNDEVTIENAEHLWKMNTHETEKRIKKRMEQGTRVLSIGPAGENLVLYANITCDLYRQFGRGGAGAVMGAKQLKAIAVKGTGGLEVADLKAFLQTCKKSFQRILNSVVPTHSFAPYGTMSLVRPMNDFGFLPIMNFQFNHHENAERISGEEMKRTIVEKNRGCFGCMLNCSKFSVIRTGSFSGTRVEGPEYETAAMLGSNCGVWDLSAVTYANLLCDRLGIDTISVGNVIGFAMECYEKGLITKEQSDGIELQFGNFESIVETIKKIAHREGIGSVLADGVKKLSEKIGKDSSKFAMHVKGMEFPGYDVRSVPGFALAYAVCHRGASHIPAWTISDEVIECGGFTVGSTPLERYSIEGKAELVAIRHCRYAAVHTLGICWESGITPILTELLSSATGWDAKPSFSKYHPNYFDILLISDGESFKVGERVFNLIRAFNVREGFRRKDDTLPWRVFNDPVPDGPVKGQLIRRDDFERMLDRYYQLMGWNSEGVPTKSKLVELGLEDVARDMDKLLK